MNRSKQRKPSAKPKRARKQRSVWKRLALGFTIMVLVVALAGLGGLAALYATTDVPNPNDDFQTNTTFIYYADGKTQMGSLSVQNRETLSSDQIPKVMKDAVIAAEDRSFWENPGFSPLGIARAAWSIASGGEIQGGSTITQQYIKILYLDSERTMKRKVRELMLAVKLGKEVPKEEVLTGYLNTIYFGRGAYGVQAASKSYFLKPVDKLSVAEAATLAALLNNPAGLNPSGGEAKRAKLLGRYQYVLAGMLEEGSITKQQYDEAYPKLPDFPEVPVNNRYGGPKGYLIKMVERELENAGIPEEQVQGGGLRITTTIDKRLQDKAVEVAQQYTKKAAEGGDDEARAEDLHVALASVDTATGALKAMYGGPDYLSHPRNWATTARPAASTFKTFAVIAGLRQGFTLRSHFNGNTFTPRGDPSPVHNQGDEEFGSVSLRRALAKSINTAFVDLTQEMEGGPDAIAKAANDAGAPESKGWERNNRLALGVAEVSPVNMANAYATLANEGKRNAAHIVEKVTDSRGNVLYEADTAGKQTVEPEVAANVVDALTSVVDEGTGAKASKLGRPVAGKTGTNGIDDKITSAWFVGMTKQISTAVMYVAGDGGTGDLVPYRVPDNRTFYGSGYPLQTWLAYMEAATEGQPVEEFSPAPDMKPTRRARPEPEPEPEETHVVEPSTEPEPTESTPQPSEEPTSEPPSSEPDEQPSEPEPSEEPTSREAEPEPTTKPEPTKSKAPKPKPTKSGNGTNEGP
ncbi:MAG: transglycosylase domain-containing protein [Propionibacteriaceae bacterium]|nr:transglycosylase domain-containing protein [Propionibacteriaceae bacterium]